MSYESDKRKRYRRKGWNYSLNNENEAQQLSIETFNCWNNWIADDQLVTFWTYVCDDDVFTQSNFALCDISLFYLFAPPAIASKRNDGYFYFFVFYFNISFYKLY